MPNFIVLGCLEVGEKFTVVGGVGGAFYYIELIKLALWKSGTTTLRNCMREFFHEGFSVIVGNVVGKVEP